MATDLRLSPGGRQVAVLQPMISVGVVASFSVGIPGSPFESIAANDLVFLDDARILTLGVDGADTMLRQLTLRPQTVVWEHRLRNLQAPRLAWRRESRRWLVTGVSLDGHLVSVDGEIGSAESTRREWKSPGRSAWADVWAVEGDTVLVAEQRFPFDPDDAGALGWTMMAMFDHLRTRLTRITPDTATELATSQLDASCTDRVFEARRLVCTAFDGTRTHVLVVDPADGTPRPIGSLPGRFVSYRPTRDGWLSGWVTSGSWIHSTKLAIDAASGRALSIPANLRADEFTVSGHVAGTLAHDASSTRVSLYRLDQP